MEKDVVVDILIESAPQVDVQVKSNPGIDVAVANRAGVGSLNLDDTMVGTGKKNDPLGVNTEVIATKEDLESKQDKLTAGANIKIEDNVISSTAQESFFRGRFVAWDNVPTDGSLYQANYRGERTPSYNDYIVVEDASTYVSDFDKTMTIVHDESTYRTIQVTENGVTTTYDLFIDANTPAEIIIGSGAVSVRADSAWFNGNINYTALRPVKVGNRYYEAGDIILSYNYYSTNTIDINYSTESNAYQGSWRFFYNGVWATDGIEGWKPEYQIEEVMPIATETQAGINRTYTAGANIRIEDNVISSTAQESFFRGRWQDWAEVPNDANSYPEDFNGNRTPTTNDYMVVVDASQYTPGMTESIIISKEPNSHILVINGVNVGKPNQTVTYTFDTVTYTVESTNGGGTIKVFANKNVQYNGQLKIVGTPVILTAYASTIEPSKIYYSKLDNLSGTWRFGYKGVWAEDNESGWKPEYQIEDTLPTADETQAGIAKLYTTSGSNTDGAMTQKAVGAAISTHNTATNAHSNIRGVAGGLATLDNNAKVPMSQINDALIGNVSYQGLWNAATNTPFLADPTGGLPAGYKALGYIDFRTETFIDTGVFIDETDETVEYDIKMTPSNTGCFPFGAAGSSADKTNTGSVYFYGSTLEYFAGNTRNIRLGEVVKDKDYLINIKLDQTTQTITVVENDLRASQNYTGSIISPVSIYLGGLHYMSGSNPTRGFGYNGKIHYFIIRKNGQTVKQYQPAQRISDGVYGFYEQVSGEFVVSTGSSFASGGGEIEIPKGYYYITTVAGDRFGLHFDVGDWIISSGGYWSKVDNTDAVVSVNGRTGNVVLGANDVGAYTKEEVDTLIGSGGGGSMPDRYVAAINGYTGEVFLGCREIGTYTSVEIDTMIAELKEMIRALQ